MKRRGAAIQGNQSNFGIKWEDLSEDWNQGNESNAESNQSKIRGAFIMQSTVSFACIRAPGFPKIPQKTCLTGYGIPRLFRSAQTLNFGITFRPGADIVILYLDKKAVHMAAPCGRAIRPRHMAAPYGRAIRPRQMAAPYGRATWPRHTAAPCGRAIRPRHTAAPYGRARWPRQMAVPDGRAIW